MSIIRVSTAGLVGNSTVVLALVFLGVFALVMVISSRILFGSSAEAPPPRSMDDLIRPPGLGNGSTGRAKNSQTQQSRLADHRAVLAKMFRGLSLLVVAVLLFLTVTSYFYSTPGTGDILLTIVLAAATLIASMHLLRLDRRYNRSPDARDVTDVQQAAQAAWSRMWDDALSGRLTVNLQVGEPEVHKIDAEGLARARAMLAEGKTIDEICGSIDSNYKNWLPPHQQAFRGIIQTALDQA